MDTNNFYEVLSVSPGASLDEIRLAFKRRALRVHPDKGGSKEAFHLAYQAFETLGNKRSKQKYDDWLAGKTVESSGDKRKTPKARAWAPWKQASKGTSPRKTMMAKIHGLLASLPKEIRCEVIRERSRYQDQPAANIPDTFH